MAIPEQPPMEKATALARKNKKLWMVALSILASLVVVFGGTMLVIEFLINPTPGPTQSVADASDEKNDYHVTDTVFTSALNDIEFRVYTAFIIWFTTIQAGLGLEFFVWANFLQSWDAGRENLWRFAQFVFPLLIMASIGLAAQHSYLALLFMVRRDVDDSAVVERRVIID